METSVRAVHDAELTFHPKTLYAEKKVPPLPPACASLYLSLRCEPVAPELVGVATHQAMIDALLQHAEELDLDDCDSLFDTC